jgi:hypothetical protein
MHTAEPWQDEAADQDGCPKWLCRAACDLCAGDAYKHDTCNVGDCGAAYRMVWLPHPRAC